MKVYIHREDFAQQVSVYVVSESFSGRRGRVWLKSDEASQCWFETVMEEGVIRQPTLTLSTELFTALADAFRGESPRADDEMLRRLKLEESRVDRLIDYATKDKPSAG